MAFLAAIPAVIGAAEGAAAGSAAVAAGTSTIALASTAVAGGLSAYGAYQQGQSQKAMMKYQAQAAGVQQEITKQTAQANITGEQNQAAMESGRLSRQQSAIRGAQEAAIGGQGLGGSGTAADIATDTFNKQQMDQMTLQYNANVKSWNITNRMNADLWGLGAQEGQYTKGAQNAEISGDISAGGSLLNTASQVGTLSYIMNK